VTSTEPVIQQEIARTRQGLAGQQAQCEYINTQLLNPGLQGEDCGQFVFSDAVEQQIRGAVLAENSAFPFSFTNSPFSARIGLSWTIFDQFQRPLQVSQASAAADDAREQVRLSELTVRTQVSQAYYNLLSAYQTVGIQETNRTAAREALRLATERYRIGSGTFFELLNQQVLSQAAETDHINAVYEYHRSVALLENAVGRSLR
jgi:outer membrane protein